VLYGVVIFDTNSLAAFVCRCTDAVGAHDDAVRESTACTRTCLRTWRVQMPWDLCTEPLAGATITTSYKSHFQPHCFVWDFKFAV